MNESNEFSEEILMLSGEVEILNDELEILKEQLELEKAKNQKLLWILGLTNSTSLMEKK